ncbi:MAG TPA: SDR family oxidoreductase [Elusimicrobiota bacterium]|jgi:dTDP-4-dehydrorhamnose reductase|nr:SDR family oxidoreductase [Elusimicrobiota bacterium]
MTPPTLLLTGATGFLGRRLAHGLSGAWRVIGASRTASGPDSTVLDLADPDSIRRAFDAARPAAVVHAGAIAGPDACELDPDLARRVNADSTRVLAGLCGGAGARLVLISTDLVFDGEKGRYAEDDEPRPLSVYGRAKLEAEEASLARAPGAAVVRICSAYGRPLGGRACFVDELSASLSRGEPVAAFTDQWRSPTAADGLAEVLLRLLADPNLEGIFHWAGADRATRFETARALCRAFGWDESLVRPSRMADKRLPAPRPRDSSLDSSRLSAALGLAPATLAEGFAALKAAAR